MKKPNNIQRYLLLVLVLAVLGGVWFATSTRSAHADAVCSGAALSVAVGSSTSSQLADRVRCFSIVLPSNVEAFSVDIILQDDNGAYDLYLKPGTATVFSDADQTNLMAITKHTADPDLTVLVNEGTYTIAVASAGSASNSNRYVVKIQNILPKLSDGCNSIECAFTTPRLVSELQLGEQRESTFVSTCANRRIEVTALWQGSDDVKFSLIGPGRTAVVSDSSHTPDAQRVYRSTLSYTPTSADLRNGGRWWAVLANGQPGKFPGSVSPPTGSLAPITGNPVTSPSPSNSNSVAEKPDGSISLVTITVPQDNTDCPLPTVEPGTPGTYRGVINTNANLRAGPSTNFARVGNLPRSAEVTVLGSNNNGAWYQLDRSGQPWIYGPLVDIVPASNAVSRTFFSVDDVTIRQDEPRRNFGAEAICFADGDDPPGSGADSSVLLRWDLTAVPAGSRVTAASIVLYVLDESDESYSLYPISQNWSESSASWQSYRDTTSWQQSGAAGSSDRGSATIGVLDSPAVGTARIRFNLNGLSLLQRWIDQPNTNQGVILANAGAINGVDFLCSETTEPDRRPKLEVHIEP